MELSPKNLSLSTNSSRERLYPTSPSFPFHSSAESFQEDSLPYSEYPPVSPVIMTDYGDLSEAGPPSHETSASPPPAKRTRLSFKGKTPTPTQYISASPKSNRVLTRSRSAALASSASSSVAGDVQVFTPPNILDAGPATGPANSRASSEISATLPTTRSRKRKADQIGSGTPSINGGPVTRASASVDAVAENGGAIETDQGLDSVDEGEPETQDQDQDQDQQPASAKRGRPKGRGGKRGGRGGRGRGRGVGALSRQNSGAPEPARKAAGRGGRRKKTSSNLRVQAVYDRQIQLRQSYREVSKVLRYATEIISEKSLEKVRSDPNYFRKVAEYDKTMHDLDAKRDSVLASHGKLYDMRAEHATKHREMEEDYARREFQYRIQDLKEKYELRCKAAVLEVIRASKPLEDPHASVAPEEYSHFRLLEEEKIAAFSDDVSGEATGENAPGPVRRKKKDFSPKKRPAKQGLAEDSLAKRPSLLSAAALPSEQPDDDEGGAEAGQSTMFRPTFEIEQGKKPAGRLARDADGGERPAVFFPRYKPKGNPPQEANNRVVITPHFEFEEDEIGIRNSIQEATGVSPNPKGFHYDLFGPGNWRLPDLKSGDFDAVQIERHRLHPQTGMPIPGACNPDNVTPPTDFTTPVARTNPVIFVSKDQKRVIETSRSAFFRHTEEDWAEFENLIDVQKALKSSDIRKLVIATGFATYDAAARDTAESHIAVEELLQASVDLEEILAHDQHAKRRKISTTSASRDILGPGTEDIQEISRDIYVKRKSSVMGPPIALDVLADLAAADAANRDTARRSPTPAKFIHQTGTQTGIMSMPTFTSPKRSHVQAFGQTLSQGQGSKQPLLSKQAPLEVTPAPIPRPLPKPVKRVPPLPLDPAESQPMMPPSMVSQPTGLPSFKPQSMPPPARGPQSMGPPPRVHHQMPPTSGHHSMAPQSAGPGPQLMPPPGMLTQSVGAQKLVTQGMAPEIMGPPQTIPHKMASPTMATTRRSPQGAHVLPQPQPSFSRPQSMPGVQDTQGQHRLPQPAPSYIQSPQVQSQQPYAHNSPYFQGPPQQQMPQPETPHQPVSYQQIQQQHAPQPSLHQQPPQQPSTALRAGRGTPSSSGKLPELRPREDPNKNQPHIIPRQHQQYYDGAADIPPYQGPSGLPPSQSIYGAARADPYSLQHQQAQQQAQHQPMHQSPPPNHVQAQVQAHPPSRLQMPAPPRSQARPRAQAASTQPQVHFQPPPPPPPQSQPQSQQQQMHPPPQFHPRQQQRRPTQAQEFQPQPSPRQSQSPAQNFQQPTRQHVQSPAQTYQQPAQSQRQLESPAHQFHQQTLQRQAQSPVIQTQQPPQPPPQQRRSSKSHGGLDGADERRMEKSYSTSPAHQFHKQMQAQPQPQHFEQRPTYATPQHPSQQAGHPPQPNQPGQQQPQFGPRPPSGPQPQARNRDFGSFGGYPDV